MNENVKPRRYVSPRRQEQARATRQAILDAAHHLFLTRGYIAASIRAIASEAEVSEPTVYAVFKDKPSILWAVVQRIIIGEEEDVPVSESDVFSSIKAEPDFRGRLQVAVQWSVDIYERGIGELEDMVYQAAAADPRYQELVQQGTEKQQKDDHQIVELLLEVAPVKPALDTGDLIDLIFAVFNPRSYRILVKERGWPKDKYEHWMFQIVEGLFNRP